jgi:hypothetical protein
MALLPQMAATTTRSGCGTLPQIGRVRRGWLFRDLDGSGWWLDDTVVANGAHRVVPAGDPSASCRVFTPMVGARGRARRVYYFLADDDHSVSLAKVARQLAGAVDEPPH